VARGVDVDVAPLREQLAGQRVELRDPLDLVAEELDPDDPLLRGWPELQRVAPNTEPGAGEVGVVALVLEVDQVAEDGIATVLTADPQAEDRRPVVDGGADAVDARDRGDDDDIASLEEGVRRGMPQPIDLVVPRRVLLDVGVRAGQVCLGLVVVEVADELLDRVFREEVAELGVQLGRERLVVREDEGRPVDGLDDLRRGHRLAGPGGAEEDLVAQPATEPVGQAFDRLGLVTGGLEGRDELEVGHPGILPAPARYRTGVRLLRGTDGGWVWYHPPISPPDRRS
jgi:hypothetical protein